MKKIILFYSVLFFGCIPTYYTYSQTCSSLFRAKQEIFIYPANVKIATPESLDVVHDMIRALDELISIGRRDNHPRSPVYSFAVNEIQKTKNLGLAIIKNNAADQNQVGKFLIKSSKWVYLGKEFSENVELALHPEEIRNNIVKKYTARVQEIANTDETDITVYNDQSFIRYNYENNTQTPDLFPPFQHKIIYKNGHISFEDYIQTKESGVILLGISTEDTIIYDRKSSGPIGFLFHDVNHASSTARDDLHIYRQLRIKNLEDIKNYKAITNNLIQNLYKEINEVKNPDLKKSILVILFFMLHEQSGNAYPLNVAEVFYKPLNPKEKGMEPIDFYVTNASSVAKETPGYEHLENNKPLFEEAVEWLRFRFIRDVDSFNSQIKAKIK